MRHALIVALLASTPALAHAQAEPTIHAEGAWSRATSPNQQVGVAYLTITSTGADRLLGASSPVAAEAQVHEMVMDGQVMRMREVAGLDLPAGQTVSLMPGGYHIMLMNLKSRLTVGETFPLHLTFEHSPATDVQVRVQPAGASGPITAEPGK